MKKIVIALASAGLFTAATPGISQAGELEEMRATLQKLQAQLEPMQARITQLEAQKDEPKASPAAASTVPVRSASAFGGNANVTLYGKLDVFAEYNSGGGKGDRVALESGGLNGSRLGLKGGADITDGVRGIFQVEAGYFANNGSLAQGGRIFGRLRSTTVLLFQLVVQGRARHFQRFAGARDVAVLLGKFVGDQQAFVVFDGFGQRLAGVADTRHRRRGRCPGRGSRRRCAVRGCCRASRGPSGGAGVPKSVPAADGCSVWRPGAGIRRRGPGCLRGVRAAQAVRCGRR
jgi:hypothetical protein